VPNKKNIEEEVSNVDVDSIWLEEDVTLTVMIVMLAMLTSMILCRYSSSELTTRTFISHLLFNAIFLHKNYDIMCEDNEDGCDMI